MRILGQFIILVTVFVMLQACASSRIAEQLQSGKISFEDGNFKSAFHKLLPLASEGNAEAEYAIGYMYYYGYGTTQDAESGLFWMNKAADQRYQPAIKAIAVIKQNKVSEEPTQQLTAERSIKEDSDEVLKALAQNRAAASAVDGDGNTLAQSLPPTKPEAVDPENVELAKQLAAADSSDTESLANAAPAVERQAADFDKEHKKKYTLQLMGSYDLADVKRTQNQLHIEDNSYCAHTQRNGRDWYVLGYGKYPAPYLAKLAIDDLPSNLRDMKPWVRQMDDMKIML